MKKGSGIYRKDIAEHIADDIEIRHMNIHNANDSNVKISTIETEVFNELIKYNQKLTAKAYEGYRSIKEFQRNHKNTTDEQLNELLSGTSDYWNNENSNKNSKLLTTQRDYMAGISSTDVSKRFLLPTEIVQAHDEGLIHFHDMDYFAQNAMTNCSLINLKDMLQNGTCINDVTIDPQHKLLTATTVATQIITEVTSSQYGGTTITLTHLAPYVRMSYESYYRKYIGRGLSETNSKKFAEEDIKKEVEDSVQTFNYQCNSMKTTNGQSPFLTVFMYLNEDTEYIKEVAILTEEFLKQRIISLKNKVGVNVTQAFPKLIYVLDENNITENSEYWYLTVLAAKCTAKRLVPDYISSKMMKELKGDVFPSMGCVDGNEVITYQYNNNTYTESFERMWNRLANYFDIESQPNGKDYYIKTDGVKIFDQTKGFVENYGIVKNHTNDWVRLTFSNGRVLTCTPNHPFENQDGKIILAKDITKKDLILIDKTSEFNINSNLKMKQNRAWLYGFMLCDSTYYNQCVASIASQGEDEIEEMFIDTIQSEYNLTTTIKNQMRGKKGNYKDLYINSNETNNNLIHLKTDFIKSFEGKAKNNRHIPNEVFSWNFDSKLSFIAGMIDADGYLNTRSKKAVVQIGSTNKELAIQQAILAQSCGMFSKIYINHYSSNKNNIRYRIEFTPTNKLLSLVKCNKKSQLNASTLRNTNKSSSDNDYIYVTSKEFFTKEGYSYDVTTASEHFTVSGIYSHNCRSFLSPDNGTNNNISNAKDYVPNEHKYYGRFNEGVVTLNLVDVALSSGKNKTLFWKILEDRLSLCHKALRIRHERLLHASSDVAPTIWQYGAFARLKEHEPIDKLLCDKYATISLGYAGLYETVKYMTGHSHSDNGIGKNFGMKVMQKLNDACEQWKNEEHLGYSVYGSPIESTTYKFAKCLRNRFGVIEGITDKNYITNSYHIPVTEKINPFDKLKIESEFQKLSLGGAISYIECADLTHNVDSVLSVLKYIYDNIMYAELNTKSDYCQKCGYDGEIKILDENNTLIWECPNCGNRDTSTMNVSRRTCGKLTNIATIQNDRNSRESRPSTKDRKS